MVQKTLKILEAFVGVESESKELLPRLPLAVEVKSLLTDFRDVQEVLEPTEPDGRISVVESSEAPSYALENESALFRGPFLRLEREATDLRFSLWGNQGYLYRFALYLLEKFHGIYSFHACALYQEDRNCLHVVIGGAGTGKTVYLLSGLERGLKLFSTETVHFRLLGASLTWFQGSLVDNVRFGTLLHDFPGFLPDTGHPEQNEVWSRKIALDLGSYKTDFERTEEIEQVVILVPRIEQGRPGFLLHRIGDERIAAKILFDNITHKLSETVLLYDILPVPGFDSPELALRRLEHVSALTQHASLRLIGSVLSNPAECWGDLLNKGDNP